jgi:hypothetical protein
MMKQVVRVVGERQDIDVGHVARIDLQTYVADHFRQR